MHQIQNCKHEQHQNSISVCFKTNCKYHCSPVFCTFCSPYCHKSIDILSFPKHFSQKVRDILARQNRYSSETFDNKYCQHFRDNLNLKTIKKHCFEKTQRIKDYVAKSISQMKNQISKDLDDIQDKWIRRLTVYQESQQSNINMIELFLLEHHRFDGFYQPYQFEAYIKNKIEKQNHPNLINKINKLVKQYNQQQSKINLNNKEVKKKAYDIQKQLHEFEQYQPQFDYTNFQKELKNIKAQINESWEQMIKMGPKSNWTYFDKHSTSMKLIKTKSCIDQIYFEQ